MGGYIDTGSCGRSLLPPSPPPPSPPPPPPPSPPPPPIPRDPFASTHTHSLSLSLSSPFHFVSLLRLLALLSPCVLPLGRTHTHRWVFFRHRFYRLQPPRPLTHRVNGDKCSVGDIASFSPFVLSFYLLYARSLSLSLLARLGRCRRRPPAVGFLLGVCCCNGSSAEHFRCVSFFFLLASLISFPKGFYPDPPAAISTQHRSPPPLWCG